MSTPDLTLLIITLLSLLLLGIGFFFLLAHLDKRRANQPYQPIPHTPSFPTDPNTPPPLPRTTFNAFELRPHSTYTVKRPFLDYDNIQHPIGERWKFIHHAFLPYDDGLSLFVEINGQPQSQPHQHQHHIRMQCRDEEQGEIINHFSDYMVEE